MEQHYVCTGECKGVSDKPMVCGAVDCPKYEKPLTACDCKDGAHVPAFAQNTSEPKEGANEVNP